MSEVLLTNEEQIELSDLGYRCLKQSGEDEVKFGWFVVTLVENRLWIHKYGATMFLSDGAEFQMNEFYGPDIRLAMRVLQQHFLLDDLANAR